jgi:hypothetical protein
VSREGRREVLTGETIGQVLSCEIKLFGVLMLLSEAEDKMSIGVNGEPLLNPTQSKTLCMWRRFLTGTWEVSCASGGGIPDRINKTRVVT